MELRIKRIDTTLPLPAYQTPGAVAFDLYTRIEATIPPREFLLLPANIVVEIPQGYALIIAARSSSAKKKGLSMRNGIAVIDQDYCGDADEIYLLVQNLTDEAVRIEKGERIAQALLVRADQATLVEVESMNKKNRGGFGTTG